MGGLHPAAGDLIRLLINHPDVELMWVNAPEAEGHTLSAAHRGLIGETYMRFTSAIDLDAVDVIFLCHSDDGDSREFLAKREIPEKMRIIDFSPDFRLEPLSDNLQERWVFALPELHRKPLVRGALKASLPGPISISVLLGLLPLAKENLLNSPIHSTVLVPSADDMPPAYPVAYLDHELIDEIRHAVTQIQTNFDSPFNLIATAAGWQRGIVATSYLKTSITLDQARDLFDEFYEDHSFTFVSESLPDLREVVDTNRCVIYLDKVKDQLIITSVIDDVLKGTVGNAIHSMNLLFGLQERVGLTR